MRIDIPDFDSFLEDMGSEGYERWGEAVDGMPLLTSDGTLEERIEEFSLNIIRVSHQFSVAMLRDYHEWLIDKLSQRSVHIL